MIRLAALIVSALLLVGCNDNDSKPNSTTTSSSTTKVSFADLKQDVSKMRHHLENNQKKLDDVYKNTTTLSKQFPKLNQQMQDQIINQSKANKNSIKQLSSNAKDQFKHLQDEINAFGKDMASKGY